MDSLSQLSLNYRNQLRPLLEMLKYKKTELKGDDWMILVRKSEQNIIQSPDQYLSQYEKRGLNKAIHHIFEEFLAEVDQQPKV